MMAVLDLLLDEPESPKQIELSFFRSMSNHSHLFILRIHWIHATFTLLKKTQNKLLRSAAGYSGSLKSFFSRFKTDIVSFSPPNPNHPPLLCVCACVPQHVSDGVYVCVLHAHTHTQCRTCAPLGITTASRYASAAPDRTSVPAKTALPSWLMVAAAAVSACVCFSICVCECVHVCVHVLPLCTQSDLP